MAETETKLNPLDPICKRVVGFGFCFNFLRSQRVFSKIDKEVEEQRKDDFLTNIKGIGLLENTRGREREDTEGEASSRSLRQLEPTKNCKLENIYLRRGN